MSKFWRGLQELGISIHLLFGWNSWIAIATYPFDWQWRWTRLTEELYGINGLVIKAGPVVIDIIW